MGNCFEKFIFLKTVEAKVIILTWYVKPNEAMSKKCSKSQDWPFSQGHSYKSPINTFNNFLRIHLAYCIQISYEDSLW